MGLNHEQAHIGEFDVDECKKIISILAAEIYKGGGCDENFLGNY